MLRIAFVPGTFVTHTLKLAEFSGSTLLAAGAVVGCRGYVNLAVTSALAYGKMSSVRSSIVFPQPHSRRRPVASILHAHLELLKRTVGSA